MVIGARIKERRKELNFSAEDLASRVGVSRATMFRYENGDIKKIPSSILVRLSKVLKTSISYLIGEVENPDPLDSFNTSAAIREDTKTRAYEILDNPNSSETDKYDAVKVIFHSLYMRSFEASNFSLEHIGYTDYVANLLGQKHWAERLGKNLFFKFVNIYGVQHNIPEGQTYYIADESSIAAPSLNDTLVINVTGLDDAAKSIVESTANATVESLKKHFTVKDEVKTTEVISIEKQQPTLAAAHKGASKLTEDMKDEREVRHSKYDDEE